MFLICIDLPNVSILVTCRETDYLWLKQHKFYKEFYYKDIIIIIIIKNH